MRGAFFGTFVLHVTLLIASSAAMADCTMYDQQIREVENELSSLNRQANIPGHNLGLAGNMNDENYIEEEKARTEMVQLGCNRAARRNDPECVAVYERVNRAKAAREWQDESARDDTRSRRQAVEHRLRTLKAERASCRAAERRAARQPAQRRQPQQQQADPAAAAAVIGTLIGIGIGVAGARSAPRQTPIGPASARPQYGPRAPMRCHPGPDGRMHCGGN